MDFQFKSDSNANDFTDGENEYHLEIKVEKLVLNKHQAKDIQLIYIFGELMNKITLGEDDEGFDGLRQEYIVHSTGPALAEKLLKFPMLIYLVSLTIWRR